MTGPFATAIIVVALLLCGWAVVLVIANRAPDKALLGASAVLEAMLVVFLIGGIVQMAGSDQEFARAEFVGYLLACAAVIPVAAWWVRDEKSLAAAGVLAVVLFFGSSSALASAYGIAVTLTMMITTVLTFFVVREGWRLPAPLAWGASTRATGAKVSGAMGRSRRS